ncbi:hypothetical protein QJQ45_029454 [Haematococcus lacustris]|nr:hypothetical protein QJQ45_029454 [Haematococcus lacustris]
MVLLAEGKQSLQTLSAALLKRALHTLRNALKGMGLYSKSHPYRRKGGHAARCACCATCTPAGSTGWVVIHVEGEAAFYRSGCSHTAIGQVTAMMSEVIRACSNLVPQQVPLAHRTCAEAAAAAHAMGQQLRGQEPASQLQPMPILCSTPTQAPAQPRPAHAPCPHHLPDQPPSHPSQSQLQGSSRHHPALPALLHLPGLSILTRPATNPVTSPAEEQQSIIHTTEEQDEQTPKHAQATAGLGHRKPDGKVMLQLSTLQDAEVQLGRLEFALHHIMQPRLQLQPDADGSVMLTVRQYGKPPSAVGSRPVELLCVRVSLSDAIGMLNKQMPEYIKHHRLAHHQLQVFRQHREAVKAGKDGKVVISCDWSEKLTVERRVEIMSEHWHAPQIGILVACAYFKNKEGAYYEHTVYVMTDGKEQSAAITQAAVNQVVYYLLAEHDMDMRQLYMWSDGCAGQFKGAPAMRQHWGMAQRFSVPMWWSYGAPVVLGAMGHRWCLELSTQEKRDDKHWDDECLTLLCSFAPDSVMQLCTLGKKLSVKMLNEYCKAVGLHVPAGTLRAGLRVPQRRTLHLALWVLRSSA